jgi:hypothetical protein
MDVLLSFFLGDNHDQILMKIPLFGPNQMCILMMIVPLSILVRYHILYEYEYSMISFGVVQLYIHTTTILK